MGASLGQTANRILNPVTLIDERLDPIYYVAAEGGRAANRSAQNNAAILRQQARNEDAKAAVEQVAQEQEAAKRSRQLAADIGSAYANWAGNGLSVSGSGDTLGSILKTTVAEGQSDISTIRDNAATKIWTHRQNANNMRASAESLLEQGENAEESAALTGASSSAAFAASVLASVFSWGAGTPAAVAAAGTAVSAAAGAASLANAYTSYRQGLATKHAMDDQANVLTAEAKTEDAKAGIEQVSGEQEAAKRQRLLANDIGSLYANWAGNGLSTSGGGGGGDTLSKAIGSTVAEGVMDTSIIRDNTAMKVWTHQENARMKRLSAEAKRTEGRNAYRSGLWNAAVNTGKGLFSLGSAGYGFSKLGKDKVYDLAKLGDVNSSQGAVNEMLIGGVGPRMVG